MDSFLVIINVDNLGAPYGQGGKGEEESTVGEARYDGGEEAQDDLGRRRYDHDGVEKGGEEEGR